MIQLSPSCAVVMKALPPSKETGISHKLVLERCEVLCQKKYGTSSAALNKLAKMGYAEKDRDHLWTRSELGETMMKNLKEITADEAENELAPPSESLENVTMNQESQFDKEAVAIDRAIENVALEAALDELRAKMAGQPPIQERAKRVYREVIGQMPTAIVQALEPITTMVDRA